jgi:cytosine/uracil/thiamine/allantoin permease
MWTPLQPWRTWRLPRARWIYLAVYLAAGAVLIALGLGAWSVLIAIAVALAFVTALEVGFRRRQRKGPVAGP